MSSLMHTIGCKEALGTLSVALALLAYLVYGLQTITGRTRPHPLSWFIFGTLTGTGFWIQWDQGAGAGSWVMGFTATICFIVCILSVWKGEREFPWYDWACLVAGCFVFLIYVCSTRPAQFGALIATALQISGYHQTISEQLNATFTDILNHYGATISAVLATAVDVLGYAPTIRRAWFRPDLDSATSFTLNSFKFIPSLFAMDAVSLSTSLYPATLVAMNAVVATLLIWRRRQLDTQIDFLNPPFSLSTAISTES